MLFRSTLVLSATAALFLAAVSASPSNHATRGDDYDSPSGSNDNAYPEDSPKKSWGKKPSSGGKYAGGDDMYAGGDDTYAGDSGRYPGDDGKYAGGVKGDDSAYGGAAPSSSAPCTTPVPTSTTPCAEPTGYPSGLEQTGAVSPDEESRPRCPAPITITKEHTKTLEAVTRTKTLPAVTHTATKTVTKPVVEYKTATKTVTKPVVEYKTVTKPVEVIKTKTCTVTSTVQEYVTKVKTVTNVATKTVSRDVYHTTTVSAGALPTGEAKSDYGPVKPAAVESSHNEAPAYGPVQSAYGY